MSSYQTITTTRLTRPDPSSLLAALRATVDPSAGIYAISESTYQIKTPAALTLSQMLAAQTAIDTAPAASPALTAQAEIDRLSIREKAILLGIKPRSAGVVEAGTGESAPVAVRRHV